jgi:hypothetical protein
MGHLPDAGGAITETLGDLRGVLVQSVALAEDRSAVPGQAGNGARQVASEAHPLVVRLAGAGDLLERRRVDGFEQGAAARTPVVQAAIRKRLGEPDPGSVEFRLLADEGEEAILEQIFAVLFRYAEPDEGPTQLRLQLVEQPSEVLRGGVRTWRSHRSP